MRLIERKKQTNKQEETKQEKVRPNSNNEIKLKLIKYLNQMQEIVKEKCRTKLCVI